MVSLLRGWEWRLGVPVRREAVGHQGVPVVHGAGEMHIENERDAARPAEAPVGEPHAGGVDELRRRGLVGRLGHRNSLWRAVRNGRKPTASWGAMTPQEDRPCPAAARAGETTALGQVQWVLPPSTLRTWPVMNRASSDAMKTMPSATSSERPRRPSGTVVTRAALFSAVPVNRVSMPVSVGPGATALTRIPDLASSSATDLVMPSTACLAPT